MIGRTISHYRVLEKLGEGGMGVVYKAEDTKLKRPVALKFLPAHLLGNEDVRKRFEREAKASAALSHPNVCRVYEIGEAEGKTFLAMELIEGESLEKEIARGPLKLDEALPIGHQIAKALEAAHKRGIIHRDIKPENIMVGEDGHVTIMDFGLAQLTEASRLTRTDETLGTVAYMSPEQTEGSGTDHRTDIWSLGVVLYEMVTGQQPFKGDYDKAVMYSILNEQPEPMTGLRTGVPMELERLVEKCLQKSPGRRYQTVLDVTVDIHNIGSSDATGSQRGTLASSVQPVEAPSKVSSAARGSRWRPTTLLSALAALLCGAMLGALGFDRLKEPAVSTSVRKFALAQLGSGQDIRGKAAISPDGTRVAFIEDDHIWVRLLASLDARKLAGTAGASQVFWSPEGDRIGYFDDEAGRLKTISAEGGTPLSVCSVQASFRFGAAWSSDNQIVFSGGEGLGMHTVPAQGGEPRLLVEEVLSDLVRPIEESPLFLGADRLIGSRWMTDGTSQIIRIRDGGVETLFELPHAQAHFLSYSSSGHLVYQRGAPWQPQGVWAIPFDTETLRSTGEPFLIDPEGMMPTVARDGTLLYLRGPSRSSLRRLLLVSRSGKLLSAVGQPQRGLQEPALSPDGGRVAVTAFTDGNPDIWIHDVVRSTTTRLTSHPAFDFEPAWSPSGDRVAFASDRGGKSGIVIKASDGSGKIRSFAAGDDTSEGLPTWSRDGRYIAFFVNGVGASFDIGYVGLDQADKLEVLAKTPFHENEPTISPDGGYVAYTSNESGRYEVYVSRFPSGERWLVSANGGLHPRWSNGGREIVYKENGTVVAVPVRTSTTLEMGDPVRLFDEKLLGIDLWEEDDPLQRSFDVSADGQRFVMVETLEEMTSSLIVVQNWYEEFRERDQD